MKTIFETIILSAKILCSTIVTGIVLALSVFAILSMSATYGNWSTHEQALITQGQNQGAAQAVNQIGQTVKQNGEIQMNLFDQKTGQVNGSITLIQKPDGLKK